MTTGEPRKERKTLSYWAVPIIFAWCGLNIVPNNAVALELPSEAVYQYNNFGMPLLNLQPKASTRVVPVQLPAGVADAAGVGKWRLVRTPGPEKGAEVVSVMHTADLLRSDPDFAGLMIRCREKAGLQIGFVVVRPFPPRSQPQIAVSDGKTSPHFRASVLPSGSVLSLPDEAAILAKGSWSSAKELTVDIEGDGAKIHGIVSLDHLPAAIALLQSNCPAQ